jgi:hypothetical protein
MGPEAIDPIQSIAALLNKVAGRADVEESAEWYLRSYLIDYKRVLLRRASSQEIEFATDALLHFCVQNLDANAPLYRDCVEIAAEGAKLAASRIAGRPESIPKRSRRQPRRFEETCQRSEIYAAPGRKPS